MFVFRFIYPIDQFPRHFLRQAFFARKGKIPMRSAISFSELSETRGILKISVDWDEPGTIHIPWFYKRFGLTFFSTETLRPRSEPFHLFRELIRGQLSRILKRVFDWELRGLVIPASIRRAIHEGIVKTAGLMAMDVDEPEFDQKGIAIFETLIHLSHLLLDQFIDQSLFARKTQTSDYPILLGIRSGDISHLEDFTERFPEFSHVFQSWNPGFTWRHIEPEEGVFRWDLLDNVAEVAKKHHLQPFFGPIVRWDRYSLPEWLLKRLDDPYTVRKSLFRYANAFIERYHFANHWVVSSGIANEFDYILVSKRIEWADAMARTIHSLNPSANVLVGIERPWGDSLRFNAEIPPLELADRLSRNRFFNGFLIGVDLGLSADATLPRDAFELNWLLDQWSSLGKPLYFTFSSPSSPSFDDPLWEASDCAEPPWNLRTQQETVHRYFLSFLTRKTIRGIFWSRYEDIPDKRTFHSDESKEDTKSFRELARAMDEDEETKTKVSAARLAGGESREGEGGQNAVMSAVNGGENQIDSNDDLLSIQADERPMAEILESEEMEIASLDDRQYVVAMAFPHSGLVTTEGTPKPAFRKLSALKSAYLG